MECLYVCIYVGSNVVGCMARMNATLWGFLGHPTMYDTHKPHNVALASGVVCLFVCFIFMLGPYSEENLSIPLFFCMSQSQNTTSKLHYQ